MQRECWEVVVAVGWLVFFAVTIYCAGVRHAHITHYVAVRQGGGVTVGSGGWSGVKIPIIIHVPNSWPSSALIVPFTFSTLLIHFSFLLCWLVGEVENAVEGMIGDSPHSR